MNGLWEFLETFEWTPSTPLASEKPMFLTLLVYLLVVFGLQEVMSSRKTPSWVNPLVTLHNFILFAYSASSFVAVVILVTQASIVRPIHHPPSPPTPPLTPHHPPVRSRWVPLGVL